MGWFVDTLAGTMTVATGDTRAPVAGATLRAATGAERWIWALVRRVEALMEARRTRMLLQALDDRTLEDIGIARHQIARVAEEGKREGL